MARYGYILLDPMDSDIGRQAMQLDTIGGFSHIFVDRLKQSTDKRPQRHRLMACLQEGDVIYTAAADRFCTHLKDFLRCVQRIEEARADLVLLEENLDSRQTTGKHMVKLLETFCELDFRYQSERKKAGIQQARASGRRIGRPPVSIPPGFRAICRAWSEGKISGREAARQSGLRSTSFYKKAGELGFKAPSKKNS